MKIRSHHTALASYLVLLATVFNLDASEASACPFCNSVSQTLRQEMESMDAVAFGTIVPGSQSDEDAMFLVHTVLRGNELLKVGQKLRVNYFGRAKEGQHFLLMGIDPPDLLWSSPLPISYVAMNYIHSVNNLPEDSLERLKFFMGYFEHPETLLSGDAYAEFAAAPYSAVQQLKPQMNREQLLDWIKDTSIPPDRRRLYLVMLGICGEPSDADLLESLMRSDNPSDRAGLDAMIACYATLKGPEGLDLIDELFLANEESEYANTYAAIMALRFHGTDGGVIDKQRLLESMRLILDRPQLADLVIPDLARWEDWSQINKLVELFKSADKEESSWVRVPVINYLRACPLKEAEQQLKVIQQLDPKAFDRARTFFPLPRAEPSSTESSALTPLQGNVEGLASETHAPLLSDQIAPNRPGLQLASTAPWSAASVKKSTSSAATAGPPNRLVLASVVGLASTILGLAMWLSITGAGSHGIAARLLCELATNRQ